MSLAILALIIGLILMTWSADQFVDAATTTAAHYKVPVLIIGMVVVGFGTSAPEILVSSMAAFEGKSPLALGNAYGSNILNIALILGLTAALQPITVESRLLKLELPILCIATFGSYFLLTDDHLSRADAMVMLTFFVLSFGWMIHLALSNRRKDALEKELEQELKDEKMPINKALFWLVGGLVLLVISSRLLVYGAVEIAQHFGVSDLVIGLTIVAIGTSLPELAASIASVRKNEHDLAIGNVIGSNMFNLLIVVPVAGLIHPTVVDKDLGQRDMPVMLFLTILQFIFLPRLLQQPYLSSSLSSLKTVTRSYHQKRHLSI